MEECGESGACAVLECFFRFYRKLVLRNKVFEKSGQMFNRYISAIGFGVECEMFDGTICIEIDAKPKFCSADVKIEISGVIFHIHQHFTPAAECSVNVVTVNRNEDCRVFFRKVHVLVFVLTDQKNLGD